MWYSVVQSEIIKILTFITFFIKIQNSCLLHVKKSFQILNQIIIIFNNTHVLKKITRLLVMEVLCVCKGGRREEEGRIWKWKNDLTGFKELILLA